MKSYLVNVSCRLENNTFEIEKAIRAALSYEAHNNPESALYDSVCSVSEITCSVSEITEEEPRYH